MRVSTRSCIDAEAAGDRWERRGPRLEDVLLTVHTQRWLNALRKGVRAVQLPATCPRIANELCSLWPETAELDRYFAEWAFSARQDRTGFAPLIREELGALHLYSVRNRSGLSERRPPTPLSVLDQKRR